jgi:excinuclease ABC subunit B
MFDVLVGVNLLREGLDLPEVSLVAILDADKEGFLRNTRSLTQTAGRAARNVNGTVIMYAEKITESMQRTIDETNRRREKQIAYNIQYGITPTQIVKAQVSMMNPTIEYGYTQSKTMVAADPVIQYMSVDALKKAIEKTKKDMEAAAKEMDFDSAARLRDEMYALQELLKNKK